MLLRWFLDECNIVKANLAKLEWLEICWRSREGNGAGDGASGVWPFAFPPQHLDFQPLDRDQRSISPVCSDQIRLLLDLHVLILSFGS